MNLAKEALIKQGYEVVPFEITANEIDEIRSLFLSFMCIYFVPACLSVMEKTQEDLIPQLA